MAQHARTTSRASETLLETATLLLAGLTALIVIARSEAEPSGRSVAPAAALQLPAPASGPASVQKTAQEIERQAALRDMLLHD